MRCGEYLNLCAGATPQRVGIASNPYSKVEACPEVDWDYIRGVTSESAHNGGHVGTDVVELANSDDSEVASEGNDEL